MGLCRDERTPKWGPIVLLVSLESHPEAGALSKTKSVHHVAVEMGMMFRLDSQGLGVSSVFLGSWLKTACQPPEQKRRCYLSLCH